MRSFEENLAQCASKHFFEFLLFFENSDVKEAIIKTIYEFLLTLKKKVKHLSYQPT